MVFCASKHTKPYLSASSNITGKTSMCRSGSSAIMTESPEFSRAHAQGQPSISSSVNSSGSGKRRVKSVKKAYTDLSNSCGIFPSNRASKCFAAALRDKSRVSIQTAHRLDGQPGRPLELGRHHARHRGGRAELEDVPARAHLEFLTARAWPVRVRTGGATRPFAD